MSFFVPNALCRYRAESFSTKEPETLDWIDSFEVGSVVWDVGSNVGLYSIYAAKKKNAQVFAFEPSFFNLEFLAKNIFVNGLQRQIRIFPLALSNENSFNLFKMNSPLWGGALSAFGVDYDHRGDDYQASFEYTLPGMDADSVIDIFNVPKPDHMKIDVDGIEHLILEGAINILLTVKSVLIEIDEDFDEQLESCSKSLTGVGLVLKSKHLGCANIYNQIWVRDE
jgi:FkbM family methyltransferase